MDKKGKEARETTKMNRYGQKEELYEEIEEGAKGPLSFQGFDSQNTAMLKRILTLERKFESWINESKVKRDEDEQDKVSETTVRKS